MHESMWSNKPSEMVRFPVSCLLLKWFYSLWHEDNLACWQSILKQSEETVYRFCKEVLLTIHKNQMFKMFLEVLSHGIHSFTSLINMEVYIKNSYNYINSEWLGEKKVILNPRFSDFSKCLHLYLGFTLSFVSLSILTFSFLSHFLARRHTIMAAANWYNYFNCLHAIKLLKAILIFSSK